MLWVGSVTAAIVNLREEPSRKGCALLQGLLDPQITFTSALPSACSLSGNQQWQMKHSSRMTLDVTYHVVQLNDLAAKGLEIHQLHLLILVVGLV